MYFLLENWWLFHASYVSLPEGKHHVEPLVCFCPALAMAYKRRLTSDDSDFLVVLMALDGDWKLNAISVTSLTNAMTYAVHPWKLTCPLKRDYFSREYIFQPLIFRGHVSFRGCSSMKKILGIQLFSMWFQSNWTRLISQIGSFQSFSGKKLTSFETTDFIPTFQVSSELQQICMKNST